MCVHNIYYIYIWSRHCTRTTMFPARVLPDLVGASVLVLQQDPAAGVLLFFPWRPPGDPSRSPAAGLLLGSPKGKEEKDGLKRMWMLVLSQDSCAWGGIKGPWRAALLILSFEALGSAALTRQEGL